MFDVRKVRAQNLNLVVYLASHLRQETMHPCLTVDEVVRNIANLFHSKEAKSLLCLGLACRAFYDPAMDVLWRSLRSIDPLLRCLPRDVIANTSDRHFEQWVSNNVRVL